MDVANILDPSSVRCEPQVSSKKHALDLLSQLLGHAGNVPAGEIADGLASRERLGSTGLGASVAMPHTKMAGIEHNVGAFLRLARAVDFDSTDCEPVDLLFGLLVPEGSTAGELQEIRELVKRLRDPELQRQLRASDNPQALYGVLTDKLNSRQAAHRGPSVRRPTGS
jgi:PTS system nitrogen regulatory IIA component